MSKSTFKILFYLRKNYVNKEGKASIMIRITVNGEMSQFSSKLDVEPRLWDTKLGRLSGNGAKAINRKTFCNAFPNHFVSLLHQLTQNKL